MASFRIFSQGDILNFVNKRDGETKLGEKVNRYRHGEHSDSLSRDFGKAISLDLLKNSPAKFVLLGIPEDIGVRANYGIGGTQTAWKPALKSFLNLQQNEFLRGEDILVLGEFDITENTTTDVDLLRKAVAEIDDLVYPIVQIIVEAGKIPIVIGGGHNNCYPIIKGISLALNEKVNVLNIDAHTDLRNPDEGRHSGNGFSTAIKDRFLEQYRIFGLHQNYISEGQLNYIANNNAIKVVYFDDLLKGRASVCAEAENLLKDIKTPLGLEIDLDCIAGALSSAATPSGFSLNEVRQLVLSLNKGFNYLHICEGAYQLSDGRKDETIGKTIAYLVSDFIKSSR